MHSNEPSRYQVVFRGLLSEYLASGFEQLELETRASESTLTGGFADQAQLHGLLERLRDLGMHLVSVNPVD